MILIYLASMKEPRGKGCGLAAAHAYLSWADDEIYHADHFCKGSHNENKLKALTAILPRLPRKGALPICVYTDSQELTWDLERICAGDEPGFVSRELAKEFCDVAAQNGIQLSQFRVKDKGAMTAAERLQLTREEMYAVRWGDTA